VPGEYYRAEGGALEHDHRQFFPWLLPPVPRNSVAAFLGAFHSATTNSIQIVDDIDTASRSVSTRIARRSHRPG